LKVNIENKLKKEKQKSGEILPLFFLCFED